MGPTLLTPPPTSYPVSVPTDFIVTSTNWGGGGGKRGFFGIFGLLLLGGVSTGFYPSETETN